MRSRLYALERSVAGFILGAQNDHGRAQACLEELSRCTRGGDQGHIAESLTFLSHMAYWTSGAARAAALYELGGSPEVREPKGYSSYPRGPGVDRVRGRRLRAGTEAMEGGPGLAPEPGEALGVTSVLTRLAYSDLARRENYERATCC